MTAELCALQGLAEPSDLEILIKSDYIVRQDSLNGKGNLNSHTCFVTKFISERRHFLSETPTLQSCILCFVISNVHAY